MLEELWVGRLQAHIGVSRSELLGARFYVNPDRKVVQVFRLPQLHLDHQRTAIFRCERHVLDFANVAVDGLLTLRAKALHLEIAVRGKWKGAGIGPLELDAVLATDAPHLQRVEIGHAVGVVEIKTHQAAGTVNLPVVILRDSYIGRTACWGRRGSLAVRV